MMSYGDKGLKSCPAKWQVEVSISSGVERGIEYRMWAPNLVIVRCAVEGLHEIRSSFQQHFLGKKRKSGVYAKEERQMANRKEKYV